MKRTSLCVDIGMRLADKEKNGEKATLPSSSLMGSTGIPQTLLPVCVEKEGKAFYQDAGNVEALLVLIYIFPE
jgi:hypothetical protein